MLFDYLQITYLNSFSGVSSREIIDSMMGTIFTDCLARHYNWVGRENKAGISKLRITTVIKDAAKFSQLKEEDTEAAMQNWLRYATDRSGVRKRRHQKKQH